MNATQRLELWKIVSWGQTKDRCVQEQSHPMPEQLRNIFSTNDPEFLCGLSALVNNNCVCVSYIYVVVCLLALPVLRALSALGVELHLRLEAITLILYVSPQDSLGMPQLDDQDMHVPKGPFGACTVAV